MNSWVEISEERLVGNYRALETAVGADTTVLAVVKANAYGHGAEVCAGILSRAGARWFGVTCAEEGVRVRGALAEAARSNAKGTAEPEILIMSGFLPSDVALIRAYGLTPVVWTVEQVDWLSAEGPGSRTGLGGGLKVHVEVDTGMGRQGVLVGAELDELLRRIAGAGLVLGGIFTHFCSSEEARSELTQRQERLFEGAMAQVREAGRTCERLRPEWVHAGNSSAVDNPAQEEPWIVKLAASVGARAMVRTGLALYGFCLPIEGDGGSEIEPRVRARLKPVMSWKARVLAVRELAAGETVGYNATFTATEAMRVAVLPVGYADGLRRELSSSNGDGSNVRGSNERETNERGINERGINVRGGGWAMVRGERARILGRVSMNLTVVDVTGIAGVRAGDVAVILGDGVSAEEHARLARTIAYEIVCGVHPCG